MKDITESDWNEIKNLAELIEYPSEKISFLKRRLETTETSSGVPLTVITGMPKCGLELALAQLLNREIAERIEKNPRPIVVGKSPAVVQPKISSWETVETSVPNQGHFIILRTEGKPPADILLQIGSVGTIEEVILVTSLSQPFSIKERELAQSFSSLAMTGRILVVGLPGEEVSEKELLEVSDYVFQRMAKSGFAGRCSGVGIWFTDNQPRQAAIADLKSFFNHHPLNSDDAKAGMKQQAVKELLTDLRGEVEKAPLKDNSVAISEEEQNRLIKDLSHYLTALKIEIENQKKLNRLKDTDDLRRYVRETIWAWSSFLGIEGEWLRYVERVKPGTQPVLREETETASEQLEFEAGSSSNQSLEAEHQPSQTAGSGIASVILKRLALALTVGLLAVVLALTFFASAGTSVVSFVSGGGLVIGLMVGYFLATLIFRIQNYSEIGSEMPVSQPEKLAKIHGWIQFERHLLTWFSEHIRNKPFSPSDEWRKLLQKLQITEDEL